MTTATGISIHGRQTRIGQPSVQGAYFPRTEEGDEIAVYGGLGSDKAPRVGLMVNLSAVELTPSEARALAFTLLHHAKQVDPTFRPTAPAVPAHVGGV